MRSLILFLTALLIAASCAVHADDEPESAGMLEQEGWIPNPTICTQQNASQSTSTAKACCYGHDPCYVPGRVSDGGHRPFDCANASPLGNNTCRYTLHGHWEYPDLEKHSVNLIEGSAYLTQSSCVCAQLGPGMTLGVYTAGPTQCYLDSTIMGYPDGGTANTQHYPRVCTRPPLGGRIWLHRAASNAACDPANLQYTVHPSSYCNPIWPL